jgi:predicted RNA binding protein YcfA (HicA-like mRNA interferase family)
MSGLDKLIERMRRNPKAVRFDELVRALASLGWWEAAVRGSHHRFRSSAGEELTVVRPHGGRAYCSPRAVLDVLAMVDAAECDDD